ncbi:MAG: putative rhamnosyl transferase [Rhodobacteraceae bacterium]|nr:putative rhamnosyl transferase [Paracoccaceae bacterium]
MKNQIIGLVRFSYIAKDGFQAKYASPEAARMALYSPDRMGFRLKIFEQICIRSLQNQTDQDFRLVVLVGTSLPTVYLKRLQEIIAPLKGALVIARPRQWMVQATQAAFKQVIEADADYVTTFRLDDDDAVAVDYIAQTRKRLGNMALAGMAKEPTVLAFTSGIYWDLAKGDDGLRLKQEAKPLGLACAMMTGADLPASIFRWNHTRFASHFQTLMTPSDIMFIRSLHSYNDSGRISRKWGEALPQAEMSLILKNRFHFDINMLTSGWSD